MGNLKEVILCVTIIFAASCESRPISSNHYAPAHEYKSIDYSFSYGVKDPHTGDVKNQWEEKKDNVVRGEYSLLEADGSTRTVQYTADDKNGFNAVVKYDHHSVHPIAESQGATSHKHLNLSPSRDSVAYSSYTNKVEGLTPLGHSEVQTVVQHEYQLPEAYTAIQNPAPQHLQQVHDEEVQQKQAYIYVPQEDNASEGNKLDQSQIQGHTEQVQAYYAYESDQNTAPPQDEEQHESQHQEVKQVIEPQQQNDINGEYAVSNIQVQLPIQPDAKNRIPVSLDSINPINIDLTHLLKEQLKNDDSNKVSSTAETFKYSTKDNSVQPSHQFTPEEVQKFIDDYNNKLNEPVFETGFVPIKTKPNSLITQPMVPNTYRSNLKVNMTPGLKHYSSRGNSKFKRNKYEAFVLGQQQLLPLLFNTVDLRKDAHRSEYSRLHRSVPNRNPFTRYAKHYRLIN